MATLLPSWTKTIALKHTNTTSPQSITYDERYIIHSLPGFIDYYEVCSGEDVLLFSDYALRPQIERQKPFPYTLAQRDLTNLTPNLSINYNPEEHIMKTPELGFNELIVRKDAGYIDLVEYYDATKVEYWIVNSFTPVEIIAGEDFDLDKSGFLPLHLGREKNTVRQWSNILSNEDSTDLFLSKLLNLNMMLVKNDFDQEEAGIFEERLLKNLKEEIFFIDRGMGEFEYIHPTSIFQLIRDKTNMLSSNFLKGSIYERTTLPNLKIISKKIRRNPFLFYKNYLMEYSLVKFNKEINKNNGDYVKIISHILKKMETIRNNPKRLNNLFRITSDAGMKSLAVFTATQERSVLRDLIHKNIRENGNVTQFIPSEEDFVCGLCHKKVIRILQSEYRDIKNKKSDMNVARFNMLGRKFHFEVAREPEVICCTNCLITFDSYITSENVLPFLDECLADGKNLNILEDTLPIIEKESIYLQAQANPSVDSYIENKRAQLSSKLMTLIGTIHLLRFESSPAFWKNINKYFIHPNKIDHMITLFPAIQELKERLIIKDGYNRLTSGTMLKKDVHGLMLNIFYI